MAAKPAGKQAITFVLIVMLLDSIGLGIIIPVLPELIMELTGEGLSRAAIYGGWLAFVYALMQFSFPPVLGNLSDRFGRRPVLLAAVGSLGIDYLIMGLAPTIGWLFVGRGLAGVAGASFTPAYAYIADVTPPEKRAQSFGLIGAAALSGLNFLYGVVVLPESLASPVRRKFSLRRANPVGTLLQVRRYPMVLGLLMALFLWQISHQVMPSTWSFYTMYKFGWSEVMVGASLAAAGVIMVLGQSILPRVVIPRFGEKRTALLGIVVASAGFVLYALATEGWMMFAILLTWGLGALVMPSTQALMSHRVPAVAQGELQGAVAGLYSLSAIIGPPLMTQAFRRFTAAEATVHFPGAAFICAALLGAGSFVLLRSSLSRRQRR